MLDCIILIGSEMQKYRIKSRYGNKSYPGGLGSATFIEYAKTTWGVTVTEQQAIEMKKLWLESFPEMEEHLNPPTDPKNPGYYIGRTLTGRIRANAEFCASCNYPLN